MLYQRMTAVSPSDLTGMRTMRIGTRKFVLLACPGASAEGTRGDRTATRAAATRRCATLPRGCLAGLRSEDSRRLSSGVRPAPAILSSPAVAADHADLRAGGALAASPTIALSLCPAARTQTRSLTG